MDMGYHDDYGLTDEYRMQVVKRAREVGATLAAAEFNVSLSAVYRWKKRADELVGATNDK